MTKNLISWLLLLATFSFMLQSCVHDEMSTSADPSSKEYHSKSLWKEDEKYIKNVMQVYLENESRINTSSGTPYWNYAVTMGTFDESFLMVPVIKGEKVISVLQVLRKGSKIHFYYTQFPEHISFFQDLVFAPLKKAIFPENSFAKGRSCSSIHVSVWIPNNPNNDNGPGHWDTKVIVRCTQQDMESCTGIVGPNGECSDGGDGGGYPYPGGGNNNPDPETPEDPCTKMKAQNQNPDFKAKVTALDKKEIFDKKVETGHAAAYGTTPFEQMSNTPNGNVKLPDGNKYFGYMHTHLDKEGVVKIFSPYDIVTFLTSCVRNAEQNGNKGDAYAMVITSQGNYILKYSGDGSYNIGPNQITNWQAWYDTEYTKLIEENSFTQPNIEKLFTQFLEQKVNINGLKVYKSDKTTGNTTKIEYNGKENPVKPTPCP